MGKVKQILIVVLAVLVAGLVGFFIGQNEHFREAAKMVLTDTLVVHDTIRIDHPVEVRYVKTTKKIRVPVTDTIRIHDTAYVELKREVREYKDSLYYARVSGYDPSLDYIEVYPKTTTISKTETIVKASHWRYSIDLGLDYRKMGRQYLLPNIGASVAFKKVSVGVECGVQVHIPDGETMAPQLYFGGGLKYRLGGN